MALKMMGRIPVEFVRVPGSWHVGTAKPSQYTHYWEFMVEWFRRYVEIHPEEYE
jgi:dipeptidyl aminopeptidase/acylaminoacyl peptidase